MIMILFTTHEGGYWKPLPWNKRRQKIVAELKRNRFYDKDLGWMSILRHKGRDPRFCHSVKFEDGHIWDSFFGKYRHLYKP